MNRFFVPTMKSLKSGSEGNGVSSEASEEAVAAPADRKAAPAEPIDFSKVEIEPLFKDFVAQLRRPDVVLLAEIFAAREQNP